MAHPGRLEPRDLVVIRESSVRKGIQVQMEQLVSQEDQVQLDPMVDQEP